MKKYKYGKIICFLSVTTIVALLVQLFCYPQIYRGTVQNYIANQDKVHDVENQYKISLTFQKEFPVEVQLNNPYQAEIFGFKMANINVKPSIFPFTYKCGDYLYLTRESSANQMKLELKLYLCKFELPSSIEEIPIFISESHSVLIGQSEFKIGDIEQNDQTLYFSFKSSDFHHEKCLGSMTITTNSLNNAESDAIINDLLCEVFYQ